MWTSKKWCVEGRLVTLILKETNWSEALKSRASSLAKNVVGTSWWKVVKHFSGGRKEDTRSQQWRC